MLKSCMSIPTVHFLKFCIELPCVPHSVQDTMSCQGAYFDLTPNQHHCLSPMYASVTQHAHQFGDMHVSSVHATACYNWCMSCAILSCCPLKGTPSRVSVLFGKALLKLHSAVHYMTTCHAQTHSSRRLFLHAAEHCVAKRQLLQHPVRAYDARRHACGANNYHPSHRGHDYCARSAYFSQCHQHWCYGMWGKTLQQ